MESRDSNRHFARDSFFPDFVEGKFDKFIFIKYYWDAAWSIIAAPISLLGNTLTVLTFLKVFDLWKPVFVVPAFIIFAIGFIYFGYSLYKRGLITRMNSFTNKFNKELQEILQNTKK